MKGELLEQQLTDQGGSIMVFGLPFEGTVSADGKTFNPNESYEHDYGQRVGFYRNMNWARDQYPNNAAHGTNVAGEAQRSNLYVYHNKVYIVNKNPTPSSGDSRRHIPVVFDDDDNEQDGDPNIDDHATGSDRPWPCDVYNMQGLRVAENETPATLRKNHPSLPKGVYIFGGRKVVVR